MYRFLLTPRWLGINLFALLAIPICILMGTWQLGRFEDRVDNHRRAERRPAATASAAVPLADVLGPGSAPGEAAATPRAIGPDDVGRVVLATGRYDAGHQQVIPDRLLDGRSGYYVLTPLRTESGRALPVVRGWHAGKPPASAPAPPSGEVTARGALQAAESSGSEGVHAGGGLPEGQLGVISASTLVNVLPYPVYDVWITLVEGDPGGAGLAPVPPKAPDGGGLDLKAFQNLGYCGEWFVFAGFVAFMWFRLFRRDAEMERDIALGLAPPLPAEPARLASAGAPADGPVRGGVAGSPGGSGASGSSGE